jgi:hypothetical protein
MEEIEAGLISDSFRRARSISSAGLKPWVGTPIKGKRSLACEKYAL